MLGGLYPGQDKEKLYEKYCIKKIRKICFTVVVIVAVLAIILISECTNSVIDDQGRLVRNDINGSEYETELIANVDDENIDINIHVQKQKYTEDEIKYLYDQLMSQLVQIVTGDNMSLQRVSTDLNLVNHVEGYPFYIQWESNNYELLDDNGKIGNDPVEAAGEEVLLNCVMTYEEYKYEKLYPILIVPKEKSVTEEIKDEIIVSIQEKQIETQYKNYLQLPMSVGEKEIKWKKSPSSTFAVVAVLSIVVLIGIWWGVDNDLAKKYKERDQLLRIDYSEFVSKLQLLISSGMTLRNAFERMEADYKNALKDGEYSKYVYEELCICLKRLRDGASESDVYIMFGNRCGQMSYKKLMSLLVQNLKKGSYGLMSALEFEANNAFEERKHIARRLGDEAQTKLLFPMILMLSVVMVIILVPAYFSFAM